MRTQNLQAMRDKEEKENKNNKQGHFGEAQQQEVCFSIEDYKMIKPLR